jgi:DNA replication licensing factor MCM4
LLYLVLDQVDEVLDRRLAKHLVSLYLEDTPEAGLQDILVRPISFGECSDADLHQPLEELSAYIDYARSRVHPIISDGASHELVQAYVEMRNMGDDPRAGEKRITATTRQLESLIRLSEAHARMRFSPFVEVEDVKEAYRLMREAIKTSAMDPRTGKIDMGMLNTGTGQGQRKLRDDMRKEILSILGGSSGGRGMKWSQVIKQLGEQSNVRVDSADFGEVIKELENEGVVKVVGEREKRTIRRIEGA